ncbi:MAG: 50S ribosomal protein L9 [Vicingaceae bacterium]
MEVILKEDVEKLGYKDEIVNVKNGYGRNFLIPKGIAVIATSSSKKMLEETKKQRAHKEEKMVAEAESMAEKLIKTSIKVMTKAGEKGKIFGSVNNIQLAKALKDEGFDIDRKNIHLKEENIKELGSYEAVIKLYRKVEATIKFEVQAEES